MKRELNRTGYPKAPRQWSGLAVLVASGPSLEKRDVDFVRGKARVLVINDCYKLAPWADCLYACDPSWWDHHKGTHFTGQKWTQSRKAAEVWGLNWIAGDHAKGLSLDRGLIHYGMNGGFQALNLAVHFGATKIILLGYDMQKTGGKSHWFGDHPGTLSRHSPFDGFIRAFESAVPDLKRAGIEVVNCSRETALECFPRMKLDEALATFTTDRSRSDQEALSA